MNTSRTRTKDAETGMLPFAVPPAKRDGISTWVKRRGVEGPVATRLAGLLKGAAGKASLRDAVAELVDVAPVPGDGEAPGRAPTRVVAVVGPSGVGKTTTLAKLAARACIDGKTVALVSCDGFRVGAIDQLERYAELLASEVHVARTPVELATILDDLVERPEGAPDMIFVDTSGRPPTSQSPEHALAGWAARQRGEGAPSLDVLLCLSATTRLADAQHFVRIFAPTSPTGVCVTKTDETDAPSGLLHAPFAAKKPLVAICHGPRVPEDVAEASPDAVASRLAAAEPLVSNTKKEGTS